MKTMEHEPAPVPDASNPFPVRALPVVIPLFGLMLLLMTGVVWAGLLWRT